MATQRFGQPRDEGGEHGPVRPVQAWSWVGATQDGDLVAQHEEFDILGGGGSAHQQDQPKHLPEDQVRQPQRHSGIMSDRRSPLVSGPARSSGTPQRQSTVSRGKLLTHARISSRVRSARPTPASPAARPMISLTPSRYDGRPASRKAQTATRRHPAALCGGHPRTSTRSPRRPARRMRPGRMM